MHLHRLLTPLLALPLAQAAAAQAPVERAVLVTLLGEDTIAVERIARGPREFTAEVGLERLGREFAAGDAQGRALGELSGRGEAAATVGGAGITVDYGRPLQRGREIFGRLIRWNQVWRAGANGGVLRLQWDRTEAYAPFQVGRGR